MNTKTYTLGYIKDCIYKELDEFSCNGEQVFVSDSDKSDLELRMIYAINSSAARVCMSMPMSSKQHLVFIKEQPVICFKQSINASEFSFEPQQEFTKLSVHFYYTALCEISAFDKNGKLVYHDEVNSSNSKLSEYKRIIDSSEPIGLITLKNSTKNLSVSDFVIRNTQDCDTTEDLISPYGQVCIPLPEDTSEVTSVNIQNLLLSENDYYVENNILYCSNKFEGKAVITYTPCIPIFTQESADDQPLSLSESMCLSIIYLAAAQLCSVENGQTYAKLMANYQNILANNYICKPAKTKISNSFYKTTRKLFGRL